MKAALPDQAPELCTITVPYTDGTSIVLSHPRAELDRLSPEDKDKFLVSAGRLLGSIIHSQAVELEDFRRVMSIEGASLVLPDDHGNSELQTLLGEHLLTGDPRDIGQLPLE